MSRPRNVSDRQENQPVAPLSVETDLALAVDGIDVTVESTGSRLLVGVETVPEALEIATRHADADRHIHTLLTATGITAEIRVRDRIVAVVGADARQTILSRVLGTAPVELRLGGTLSALGTELVARGEQTLGALT